MNDTSDKFARRFTEQFVADLLLQAFDHKASFRRIDPSWYQALANYLSTQSFSGNSLLAYKLFCETEEDKLAQVYEEFVLLVNKIREEENAQYPVELVAENIIDAGKTLKITAIIAAISFVVYAIGTAKIAFGDSYDSTVNGYGILAIGGTIFTIIIVILLFRTGRQLEKSVRRKPRQ